MQSQYSKSPPYFSKLLTFKPSLSIILEEPLKEFSCLYHADLSQPTHQKLLVKGINAGNILFIPVQISTTFRLGCSGDRKEHIEWALDGIKYLEERIIPRLQSVLRQGVNSPLLKTQKEMNDDLSFGLECIRKSCPQIPIIIPRKGSSKRTPLVAFLEKDIVKNKSSVSSVPNPIATIRVLCERNLSIKSLVQSTTFVGLPCESEQSVGFLHEAGFSSLKNARMTQEDTCSYLGSPEWYWTGNGNVALTPEQIGKALQQTYVDLDRKFLSKKNDGSGTTSVSVVYDAHTKTLISANLADSVSFVVAYDKLGHPLGVHRLNKKLHKAEDIEEKIRVEKAGGSVGYHLSAYRINDVLNIARSIGDDKYKYPQKLITAEASVDIIKLTEVLTSMGVDKTCFAFFRVITATDGLYEQMVYVKSLYSNPQVTPGKKALLKELNPNLDKKIDERIDMQEYVLARLKEIPGSGLLNEAKFTLALSQAATSFGAREIKKLFGYDSTAEDNVTVCSAKITSETRSFILNTNDGHCGAEASTFVAKEFISQFFSVYNTLASQQKQVLPRGKPKLFFHPIEFSKENDERAVSSNQLSGSKRN